MLTKCKVCGNYKSPALTVDAGVIKMENEQPKVLLIQRGKPPFKGQLAFPGG